MCEWMDEWSRCVNRWMNGVHRWSRWVIRVDGLL